MNTPYHKDYKYEEKTLCERCQKACGQCMWSAMALPVPGWTAQPTEIKRHRKFGFNSFRVISCPLFRADEPIEHTVNILADRVKPLCFGILLSAVRDYAHYLIKADASRNGKKNLSAGQMMFYVRREERWFHSPLAIDICDICGIHADPEQIIQAVRADPLGVVERLKKNYSPVGEIEDEYTEY